LSPGAAFRFGAVVVTDLRLRLRQTSTLVVFLLLSALPYLWVPDPATGRAVFVVDERRVLYDSAALGLATGVLCSVLLGLFGYYLVSNSLARDLRTRCGWVIASTPVGNLEYLLAKVAGHVAFLATLGAGSMVCAMAMQVVRGEAPLAPWPFAVPYLLLLPPTLVFVSAVAVLFESVPWLSGKLGDVLFFAGWMTFAGLAAALEGTAVPPRAGPRPSALLDVSGLGFVVQQMRLQTGSDSFSIGATTFDPGLEPLVYPGLALSGEWLLARLAAFLPALPVLLLAVLAFHRFDPARVRGVAARRGRGWLERLQALVRPLTRPLLRRALAGAGAGPNLPGAVVSEAALTLLLQPLGALALAVTAVLALALSAPAVAGGVLPAAIAALGLVLAGAAGREARCGTTPLVAAIPALDRRYVGWKLAAAMTVGLAFTLVPALRLLAESPARAAAVLVGTVFVAGTATALGVLGGSPKAFLALFLTFLYVALNDAGRTPALDFAGFSGTARPAVWSAYLLVTAAALALAAAVHRRRRAT
jgi:hypothetical protein